MGTDSTMVRVTEGELGRALDEARKALDKSKGQKQEIVLDFSSVHRIDAASAMALRELSAAATDKQVRLAIRGTQVDVYKVLKLTGVADSLSFLG